MKQSIKQRQLQTEVDEDQDYFDNLIKIRRDKYEPNPTGTRVHLSVNRTRIMRGGLGSGKSRCGTEHINHLALSYPRSTHLIGRKDLTSLKETTQKEFLEKVVDSAMVDQFHVNDNKLFYKNGSQILFRELKEPDKVKSLEITSYMIDEADENPTPEIWEKLDDRLRQKVWVDGELVTPPYAGLLVFNPVDENHWLYSLAIRTDINLEDFRFDTYENRKNLPDGYIQNLLKKLPAWEVDRLVHGHWGRTVNGRPVYHDFKRERNVRPVRVMEHLPLLVGWDFGYNHPALVFCQLDPATSRLFVIREYLGKEQRLQDTPEKEGVVTAYRRILNELVGGTQWPIFHFGDPHGNDQKDVGESSIEYLRIHHGIHVASRREKIRTGMEEIQHRIGTLARLNTKGEDITQLPLLVVDPSCRILITAFEGGYHRNEDGEPVKDGFYDHLSDAVRYVVANTMTEALRKRYRKTNYKSRNPFTGY